MKLSKVEDLEETAEATPESPNSMLACLAPAAAPAAAVVSANAAYTQRLQAPKPATSGNGLAKTHQARHDLFDLGSSLLLGFCLERVWIFR